MPKVSTTSFVIDGKRQSFDIYYSKKEQFEIKGFPHDVIELGKPEDRGAFGITKGWETENQLNNAMQKMIDLYHNKKATSKKVILFYVSGTAETIMNRTDVGSYVGRKNGINPDVRSMHGERGWGMAIQYYVAMRTENNGTRYNQLDENGSVRGTITHTRDMQEIEWTQQREDTFKSICIAIENMVRKVSDVMYDDKKRIEFLDSPKQLLLQ